MIQKVTKIHKNKRIEERPSPKNRYSFTVPLQKHDELHKRLFANFNINYFCIRNEEVVVNFKKKVHRTKYFALIRGLEIKDELAVGTGKMTNLYPEKKGWKHFKKEENNGSIQKPNEDIKNNKRYQESTENCKNMWKVSNFFQDEVKNSCVERNQFVKNQSAKLIMHQSEQISLPSQLPTEMTSNLKSMGISKNLFNIVRIKEQAIATYQIEKAKKNLHGKEELVKLAEFLVTYYSQNGKRVLYLENVIKDAASTRNVNILLGESEVKKYIQLLMRAAPGWLCIVDSSLGEFIKINKTVELSSIIHCIQELNLYHEILDSIKY